MTETENPETETGHRKASKEELQQENDALQMQLESVWKKNEELVRQTEQLRQAVAETERLELGVRRKKDAYEDAFETLDAEYRSLKEAHEKLVDSTSASRPQAARDIAGDG